MPRSKHMSFLSFSERWGRWAVLGFFIISLFLLSGVFYDSIRHLYYIWQKEEYSHAFLIPLIALLLGLHRLAQSPPPFAPSWHGVFLQLLSFVFASIGAAISSPFPVYFALWLCLVGAVSAFWGKKAMRTLMPALIYLVFCFPAPTEIYSRMSLELQLASSAWGAKLLMLLNIPVFQDGNIIDLGTYKLQVVEACSGLRYLFPLMSFSYLIAYLFKSKMWKRAVIFISAVPLTIAMNAFRIAVTGIAVDLWGLSMAEGFIHDFQGWVVFALCVLLLLAETQLLGRLGGRKGKLDLSPLGLPHGPFVTGDVKLSSPGLAFAVLLLVMLPFATQGCFVGKPPAVPRHTALSAFPLTLGSWRGTNLALDAATLKVLKLTDYVNIDYTSSADRASVNLYVAYLASQTMGIIVHPPTNCLPGAGWKIEKEDVVSMQTDTEAFTKQPLRLARLLVRSGEDRMLVYFWYEQQGQRVTSQVEGRLRLMKNSLLYNRTDGALVRVSTVLLPTETEAEGERRVFDLLSLALPDIAMALPQSSEAP
ncbi:MAG: VPLPA-CTERM-specific exosortase XrtD [Alphaproteobacteria bacterium]|nr:VPLPA-CTERM-specific exosortase XrtD [Alphaproteobacteria bacterium]